MYKLLTGLVLVGGLALAACGETKSDRALSGGALGAAGGAADDKNDIDLGKPIWR